MGHGAWGMGHGAWGIGHWAWGMGHGTLGMGHWALGIGIGLAPMPHFLENRYTLKGFSLKLIQQFPAG